MNRGPRRLGLQAWLVAAFIAMGTVASLAVLFVVLPTLEGSIRKDEAGKSGADTIRIMVATANELDAGFAGFAVQTLASQLEGDVRLSWLRQDGAVETFVPEVSHGYLRDTQSRPATAVAQSTATRVYEAVKFGGRDIIQAAILTDVNGRPAILEVGRPVQGTAARLASVRRRVLLAVALVLGLATLAGAAIARILGARIRRLAGTAATLASGDLATRAVETAPQELASLGESLNAMASRLQGLVAETVSDRDRAHALVASLAEGVVAVSDRGEVTVANESAQILLGIPPSAGAVMLSELPAAVREVVEEARAGSGAASVAEATLGGGVEVIIQAVPLTRGAGVVLTIRDVTEERRLARARRDLIANVSHELKTPLTAVKGFLELLESEHLSTERRAEFLGLMGHEVQRLEHLIAEQLELARLDAGALPLDREAIDLAEVAAEVASSRRLLAERRQVELAAPPSPTEVVVDADPARVEQILLILLDNAIKHTPPGGKITVGVGADQRSATLSVRDTGSGIPVDAQPFIFDRFYQADPSREGLGTGLGLAIARGLAEAHGGSIEVRSTPGVGSVFTVRLPLATGARQAAPAGR